MQEKILTVIVPTYNMSWCLNENLKSYVSPETDKRLSVIVLDNSSEDESFEIAKRYENLYPSIFKAIRKENRGYGSSVNLGIEICKTKYLKVIDADDSVNTKELESLLSHLVDCDADVIQTPYYEVDMLTGDEKLIELKTEFNKLMPASAIKRQIPTPSLHTTAIRTSLLRENGISLLENAFFVDEELATYPFFYAKSFIAFDDKVYKYTVNNENQSISLKNKIKYLSHREAVVKRMMTCYENARLAPGNEEFAKWRVALSLGNHFTTLYILHPERKLGRKLAKAFSKNLKSEHPQFFKAVNKKRIILKLINFFGISEGQYEKLKKRFL